MLPKGNKRKKNAVAALNGTLAQCHMFSLSLGEQHITYSLQLSSLSDPRLSHSWPAGHVPNASCWMMLSILHLLVAMRRPLSILWVASWQVHGQDGFIHVLLLERSPAWKSPTGFSFLKHLFHTLGARTFSIQRKRDLMSLATIKER